MGKEGGVRVIYFLRVKQEEIWLSDRQQCGGECDQAVCDWEKSWLFSAGQSGATASTNLYSLIETAKVNGVEPYAYLRCSP